MIVLRNWLESISSILRNLHGFCMSMILRISIFNIRCHLVACNYKLIPCALFIYISCFTQQIYCQMISQTYEFGRVTQWMLSVVHYLNVTCCIESALSSDDNVEWSALLDNVNLQIESDILMSKNEMNVQFQRCDLSIEKCSSD
jgi:hypothetical protein